ncbi:MFS transporter [Phycicoccus sonneratiae]|uniref:MFS transporter n=1 Tax=Phycicoccus sonneratiae TaxID=2807628 RepID=A0ABS2CI98_9MICO|nr:MFS transporter [Phycicoccus sonneraticus]MBM6399586.1 MFS transporter [Phycicoccus sonneraticus]
MVPRLTPPVAFVVVGATLGTVLAAASAPSPLYPAYQQAFGFSAATLTVVFAVYVLALLWALLVVGRLSDHLGRRPVLAAALVLLLGSLGLFLTADDTSTLLLARVVQGLATGTATAVLGAYLLDLQRYGTQRGSLVNGVAPTAGLAVGGLLAGVLAQYAPLPLRTVYSVLAVVVAGLLLAVPSLPETAPRRPGALGSLRPVLAVPGAARRVFARSVPAMVSTWSLGGLMLSVSGSVLATRFGVTDHAVSGLVIGAFSGAGALASFLARGLTSPVLTRAGLSVLVVGLVGFTGALAATSLPLLAVAVVVAGAGFGTSFLGMLRALSALAQPHERSALMSAVYTVSYLAFSVPAVVAGVVAGRIGLSRTVLGYAALVAVLAAGALAAELLPGSRRAGPTVPAAPARVPAATGCGAGRS